MQNYSIDIKLMAMKKLYFKNLPAQIAELERLNALFFNDSSSLLIFNEMCRKLHNLIGSSGIWHLKDISKKSRETLDFLESENPGSHAISIKALEKLRSYIIALKCLTQRYVKALSQEHFQITEFDHILPMSSLEILVATDDEFNKDKLALDLSFNNHQITFVENGQEALKLCIQKSFQFVILEINLPIMNGYMVAHQLRSVSSVFYAPILFLTANDKDQDLVRCIEAGGDDYICKPYKANAINAKIFALHRLSRRIDGKLQQ